MNQKRAKRLRRAARSAGACMRDDHVSVPTRAYGERKGVLRDGIWRLAPIRMELSERLLAKRAKALSR